MEKIIPNSDDRYAVNINGEIISYCNNSPKILKTSIDMAGYPYKEISIVKGSNPINYHVKDLIWNTFNDNADRTGFYVDMIDGDKLNVSLDNLKLTPIGEIPDNFEDMEDYEASTTQPELDKEQEFIKKLMSMTEDQRQKYLNKRNTFEKNKQHYHLHNFLNSVGYDDNYLEDYGFKSRK